MTDETQTDTAAGEATVTEPVETAAHEPDGEKKPDKLTQQVEMKDVGPCKKHIKVTVDRANIDKRLNDKYSELVNDANVAGFRPGKAPRKIIERRFRKDVVDQVKGEIMLQSLEQLADENDVAPLSPPNLDPAAIVIPDQGPMIYEFDVEVRPQFDLPDYKGLKLRRPVREFGDTDVDEEEHRLLTRYGQVVPKESGKAELHDVLTADVSVKHGERLIGDIKETPLRIERQLAFKDGVAQRFFEQVKGVAAGEARTFDITLSNSVADPSLAGLVVKATAHVKEVKTVRLPGLTHELLHEFGVHSREQLRERILVILRRRLEYLQRQSARQQVLQHITAASGWQLPNDLLARQARAALGRRIMEMRASGMSDDEITARQRLLSQDVLQTTAVALKEHFVLQKIAEVEKIEVSDDDIADEIERLAAENNESPRRIRARLEKEDLVDSLAIELIERKVLDLILDGAEYQDVPLGAEAEEHSSVATVEEQAVPGEMKDVTAEAQEKPAES